MVATFQFSNNIMTKSTLENEIALQVSAEKDGIYEAFLNQNDYLNYFGCEMRASSMKQRFFVVVFEGEVTGTIFTSKGKAIAEFLDLNGVSSFKELENK